MPSSQLTLAVSVIRCSLETLLVTTVCPSTALHPASHSAPDPAIAVAAVARPADRERRVTPDATQQVEKDADDDALAHDAPSEWTSRRDGEMLPAAPTASARRLLSHPAPAGRQPAGAFLRARRLHHSGRARLSARMTSQRFGHPGQNTAFLDGRQHARRSRGFRSASNEEESVPDVRTTI